MSSVSFSASDRGLMEATPGSSTALVLVGRLFPAQRAGLMEVGQVCKLRQGNVAVFRGESISPASLNQGLR